MKTKSEQKFTKYPHPLKSQSGNALIYVLIAIALFAALSFTFARQNRNETTSQLDNARAETYATQLIGYSAQVKSVIDQMTMTGTQINALLFTLPSDTGFNSPPLIHKIYHPSGGGLSPFILPPEIAAKGLTPPAGVYLGLFNTVEWTPSTSNDIMLAAYGITRPVCAALNAQILGKGSIPVVSGDLEKYFIDASFHSSNQDLEVSDCAECENKLTLCISDSAAKTFVFYTIITPK